MLLILFVCKINSNKYGINNVVGNVLDGFMGVI